MVRIENLAGLRFESDIWVSTPVTKKLEYSDQIFVTKFCSDQIFARTTISPPFAGISVQRLFASPSGLETC